MEAYLGADWSRKELVCSVVGEEGWPDAVSGTWLPTIESVAKLVERARDITGARRVHVAIEAGADHWVRLLDHVGAVVHVIDGKQARRFAESTGSSGAKDDRRDADALALLCRSREHEKPVWEGDPELDALDALGATEEIVTQELTRNRQRIRELVARHMPLVNEVIPKNLNTRWMMRFLRAVPTPWHAARLERADLDGLMAGARDDTKGRMWTALQSTSAPWLTAKLAKILAVQMRVLIEHGQLLQRQLHELEKHIDALTSAMSSRTQAESFGGIAQKLAVSLIRYGTENRIPAERDAIAVRMGAAPVFKGSGKNKRGENKGVVVMRRSASPRARRAVHLLGRSMTQRLGWARAMYADGAKRGQEAATIFRRIARCVLRIYAAMLRTGEPYDDARYVATLKRRGVPWAATL